MTRTKFTLFALTTTGALLAACGGGETSGSGGSGGGGSSSESTSTTSTSTTSTSTTSTSTTSSSSATSSSSGMAGAQLKVLASFNGANQELPEGVAVTADGKTAYVGFAPTGKIVKVSLPEGTVTPLGGFEPPLSNGSLLLGLIVDAQGNLFAGVAGQAKGGAGVYQIDTASGKPTLVVDDPKITFPNGFVFQADGSLLFTDSHVGSVFKADLGAKKVTEWVTDPLLAGVPAPGNKCAESLPPDPTGANGIAIVGNNVFVANVQNATLIRIPVDAGGNAGTPVLFAQSDAATCAPLQGIDGIAADADGSLLYVGNTGNTLGRIGTDGKATPILAKDPLFDFPASISIATVNGERFAIITNFAIGDAAKPGLLSYGPLP